MDSRLGVKIKIKMSTSFNETVFTIRRELKMTLQFGPNELISGLKKRLRLYQDKRPYRQGAK
jgi:hypothetical protein